MTSRRSFLGGVGLAAGAVASAKVQGQIPSGSQGYPHHTSPPKLPPTLQDHLGAQYHEISGPADGPGDLLSEARRAFISHANECAYREKAILQRKHESLMRLKSMSAAAKDYYWRVYEREQGKIQGRLYKLIGSL